MERENEASLKEVSAISHDVLKKIKDYIYIYIYISGPSNRLFRDPNRWFLGTCCHQEAPVKSGAGIYITVTSPQNVRTSLTFPSTSKHSVLCFFQATVDFPEPGSPPQKNHQP